jgi:single-stranded-DNA-specific exonuclease
VDGLSELRLPEVLSRLLVRRGLTTADAARSFLRPGPHQIHDASGLAGVDVAVERILRARTAGEVVLVHGDYDVDGICATALLVRAFGMMRIRAVPFVPHRVENGYDLGPAGIAAARSAGARLIVTADCGITAHGAVEAANRAGIDVIVTDHHTPPPSLPAAIAVLNPNRVDCPYPEKSLAGVAVAYKLAQAVAERAKLPPERLAALLDLVAIATIADLAPLTAENRALVRWGTSVLQRTPNPGLRALLQTSGLSERDEINAGQIAFILAPRLNAVGRMGDAMRGVRLLLTDDTDEAKHLATIMEEENRRRRELDEATLVDALRMLDDDFDPSVDRGVVLASPDWHAGVIGIVASRVVERIHRPTVLIALGGTEGKGSARSIRGFHLYQAFAECAEHLIRFGGHRAAAGCSIEPAKLPAFREAFDQAAGRALTDEMLLPTLEIDARIEIGEATLEICRMLKHFGPFGIGNPSPVFATFAARLTEAPRVVGSSHLRLSLASGDDRLAGIGFGMADRVEPWLRAGALVDVAFRLEENRWRDSRGRERPPEVQMRLVDVRPAS